MENAMEDSVLTNLKTVTDYHIVNLTIPQPLDQVVPN